MCHGDGSQGGEDAGDEAGSHLEGQQSFRLQERELRAYAMDKSTIRAGKLCGQAGSTGNGWNGASSSMMAVTVSYKQAFPPRKVEPRGLENARCPEGCKGGEENDWATDLTRPRSERCEE